MTLSHVIHYPDTNSVEVTWVDSVSGAVTRCHSYSDRQMGMLSADLGESLQEHQALIDLVLLNQQPLPVDQSPVFPATITALQGLLAIGQNPALAAAYESWANDPARTFAQRAFINKAQTWRRDDATLAAAATEFGLSGEQVDGLFALAATL